MATRVRRYRPEMLQPARASATNKAIQQSFSDAEFEHGTKRLSKQVDNARVRFDAAAALQGTGQKGLTRQHADIERDVSALERANKVVERRAKKWTSAFNESDQSLHVRSGERFAAASEKGKAKIINKVMKRTRKDFREYGEYKVAIDEVNRLKRNYAAATAQYGRATANAKANAKQYQKAQQRLHAAQLRYAARQSSTEVSSHMSSMLG